MTSEHKPHSSDRTFIDNVLGILNREFREGNQWTDAEMRSLAERFSGLLEQLEAKDRAISQLEGSWRECSDHRERILEQLEAHEQALYEIARGDFGLFTPAADRAVKALGTERYDALEAAESNPASEPHNVTAYGPEQPGWADYAGPPVQNQERKPE